MACIICFQHRSSVIMHCISLYITFLEDILPEEEDMSPGFWGDVREMRYAERDDGIWTS